MTNQKTITKFKWIYTTQTSLSYLYVFGVKGHFVLKSQALYYTPKLYLYKYLVCIELTFSNQVFYVVMRPSLLQMIPVIIGHGIAVTSIRADRFMHGNNCCPYVILILYKMRTGLHLLLVITL